MSTLLFYNFKGGVGKTTISVLAADYFSRSGKKVLLIDLDAQASATLFFKNSYGDITPKRSLFNSLQKESLQPSICHLDKNLDLIPGDWDMSLWNQSLEKLPQHDRNLVLKEFISPLKEKYDFLKTIDLKDLNVDLVDAFIRLLPNYIFDIHRFFIYNNIFNFTIY